MANRLIGMERTSQGLRLAVLGEHRGQVTVVALEHCPYPEDEAWPEVFTAMVPGGLQLTDLIGAAIPGGQAYVRLLHFPFKDRRKIMAAAPFELAAQLPVTLEECHTVFLPPGESGTGATVVAAAVPKTHLDTFLQPFEEHFLPLQVLDLMPHALAAGVGEVVDTGTLLCLNEGEATLVLLVDGRLTEHRHYPLEGTVADSDLIHSILRDAVVASQRLGVNSMPAYLTGALATPRLFEELSGLGFEVRPLPWRLGHRDIPAAFVPAVAMALRLAKKTEDRCFNLRQGAYAYRGEAARLKGSLYGLGAILGASLILFGAATLLDYQYKRRQAEALQLQMTRQYQETFPGSAITVDVALQMQSKLQELRNRAQALGVGTPPQVLPILKELSGVVAGTAYEVESLTCDEGSCSLAGAAASFEAVNRMKTQFEASPLFAKVEITETRKGLDGSRVEFRLRLQLRGQGGKS